MFIFPPPRPKSLPSTQHETNVPSDAVLSNLDERILLREKQVVLTGIKKNIYFHKCSSGKKQKVCEYNWIEIKNMSIF